MIIRPGMFISDRYEIIDKVGSGGMADVFKAKDHRLNRYVAMKVLKAEFSGDTKFVEKFRAEAQSAAGLSHPNTVNVYDVGDEEDMYYIVMELVEGITLKSFIERKGRLDVKEAVGIAIQIAQGMEAAHSNHIIHRDIKPQNIIISREGKVKVTDFGIAKAVTSDTITSNAMGSVHYLSPEQARGGFSDEKSDIYSLGVTMYEMLTGRVPFIGDNTVSVALCHLQEEPVPLRDIEPSIPVSLDKIVQKCMQKKPEHRYLSASALIADLKKSLTNPDGRYVQIMNAAAVADSPTISFSPDDLEQIKQAQRASSSQEPESSRMKIEPERPVVQKEKVKAKAKEYEDEDDEDEDVKPALEKLMRIGGVLAAILIVFIVVFIIVKLSGCFGGNINPDSSLEATATPVVTEEPVVEKQKVPDVTNLEFDKVKEDLENMGLLVTSTEVPSDTVEAGYIVEQSVEEGTEIDEDMMIQLTVSSGSDKITVENVVGRDEASASSILKAQGFAVSTSYVNSEEVEKGKVIKTSPVAGSQAAKGDTITLYISKGPEDTKVEVPSLSGMTEAEAKKALQKRGLELSTENTFQYDDTVESGKIIAQDTSTGSKVEKGTKISVTISNGKKPRYVASNVTISENPFETEDQTGIIKCILKQDGTSTTIYEESQSLGDFPLRLPSFEGKSQNTGELYVYLDGELVGGPISVTFEKVTDE